MGRVQSIESRLEQIMKKREVVIKYLTALAEIHNKPLSEVTIMIYWKVLEKYSSGQLESAFDQIIKSSKFFPKPVEIIEMIAGGKEDRALTAWTRTINAVRKYGHYSSVDFGDPLIVRTISLIGGWGHLCRNTTDEMIWTQKEFERVYKNLIISNYSGKDTKVIGHIEAQNTLHGYADSIPEIIDLSGNTKQIEEK